MLTSTVSKLSSLVLGFTLAAATLGAVVSGMQTPTHPVERYSIELSPVVVVARRDLGQDAGLLAGSNPSATQLSTAPASKPLITAKVAS